MVVSSGASKRGAAGPRRTGLTALGDGSKVEKPMKINRLMQAVFVAGSACVVVPAFAASTPSLTSSLAASSLPSPQCGGDEDDDDGDEDDDDQGETRLCGGDSDDDDGDDDGENDDGGETRAPAL